MQDYNEILAEILIDEDTLQARVKELGAEISADYTDGNLLLICILRGGVPFMVDLSRHITSPHMMDFMAVSSYGVGKRESSGAVRVSLDLQTDIHGKDVLLVEDIVDSGHTLSYLYQTLQTRHPASLRTCALVRKQRESMDFPLDYLGFDIPDVWVVGYGLDYADLHRTLPFIAELKPEVYQK